MKLVIFEDNQFDRFLPLAWVRGVFELRCGATTLAEKIARAAGRPPDALLLRDYLVPTARRRAGGAALHDLSACRGEEVLLVSARAGAFAFRVPPERGAQRRGERLAYGARPPMSAG